MIGVCIKGDIWYGVNFYVDYLYIGVDVDVFNWLEIGCEWYIRWCCGKICELSGESYKINGCG